MVFVRVFSQNGSLTTSNPAKHVINHLPSFISNTWLAPKHVLRVNLSLDFQQTWIITAPKCFLEVWLVCVGLYIMSVTLITSYARAADEPH
jgi:hypothetical protein